MRKAYGVLALAVILVLMLAGCGGADDGSPTVTPAATTPAAVGSSSESPAAEWSTVVTLSSSDPTNDMDLHVSETFAASGDGRVVLDMPDGGDTDGIIAAFLPADEPITVQAAAEAQSVSLAGAPAQAVSDLDGDYVLLVTPSTTKEWSVEVQTRG